MARYEFTKTFVTGNKTAYGTTIYDDVPERNDDMYFISQHGDRCDILADRFYGDSKLWWFIARINHLKTMNIPAGTSLRIPVNTTFAKGK